MTARQTAEVVGLAPLASGESRAYARWWSGEETGNLTVTAPDNGDPRAAMDDALWFLISDKGKQRFASEDHWAKVAAKALKEKDDLRHMARSLVEGGSDTAAVVQETLRS